MSRGLRGSMWSMLALGVVVACGSSVEDSGGSKFDPEASNAAGPGGASDSFGSSGGSTGGKACSRNADCEDQDACTRDQCVFTGEFGTCKNTHIEEGACKDTSSAPKDAGDPTDPTPPPTDPTPPPTDPTPPPTDPTTPPTDPPAPSDPITDVTNPLDPMCSNGQYVGWHGGTGLDGGRPDLDGGKDGQGGGKGNRDAGDWSNYVVYPPFVPLKPDDVPASCHDGFQLRNLDQGYVYTLAAKSAAGSRAVTLDVDYASYRVPNGVTIKGIDAAGKEYTLLDTCRMQTWDEPDPTDVGSCRPLDETIRQFRIGLRAGTKKLTVQFYDDSPMYLRVVGLCDFKIPAISVGAAEGVCWEAIS